MEEAKDTLTKENENRGFMAGCEDEFDEDERSAKLIYLRYADLIEECGVVQVPVNLSKLLVLRMSALLTTGCATC